VRRLRLVVEEEEERRDSEDEGCLRTCHCFLPCFQLCLPLRRDGAEDASRRIGSRSASKTSSRAGGGTKRFEPGIGTHRRSADCRTQLVTTRVVEAVHAKANSNCARDQTRRPSSRFQASASFSPSPHSLSSSSFSTSFPSLLPIPWYAASPLTTTSRSPGLPVRHPTPPHTHTRRSRSQRAPRPSLVVEEVTTHRGMYLWDTTVQKLTFYAFPVLRSSPLSPLSPPLLPPPRHKRSTPRPRCTPANLTHFVRPLHHPIPVKIPFLGVRSDVIEGI
jgi:hypothetical protein